MDSTAAPERTFRILAVCTGNICRSPAMAALLAERLGDPLIHTSSAGTGAMVGQGVERPMAELLRQAGMDVEAHRARRWTVQLSRQSDLVLTATRAQRSLIVEEVPAAVRRTFTIREFARLVDGVALPPLLMSPGDRLRALVPLAALERGVRRPDPVNDDVIDPYLRPAALYATSYAQILAAVDRIADTVNPPLS